MRDYKEFEGKTLDDAIAEACSYYDVPREKLEIEILQDANGGIFGLMGTRKAKISARRAQLAPSPRTPRDESERAEPPKPPKRQEAAAPGKTARHSTPAESQDSRKKEAHPGREKAEPQAAPKTAPKDSPGGSLNGSPKDSPNGEAPEGERSSRRRRGSRGRRGETPEKRAGQNNAGKDAGGGEDAAPAKPAARPGKAPAAADFSANGGGNGTADLPFDATAEDLADGLPLVSLESLDQELLTRCCLETVERLTAPIVGEVGYTIDFADGRVRVGIDCGEDFALLIGRDGQTLSALQYMCSRIISRRMGATVRVQLEGGNYRERQNEKLREMAVELARKLHETGKAQYTRMLSSYHRRVVHMALQDDPEITTRSKGDGPMKRVAIMKKK